MIFSRFLFYIKFLFYDSQTKLEIFRYCKCTLFTDRKCSRPKIQPSICQYSVYVLKAGIMLQCGSSHGVIVATIILIFTCTNEHSWVIIDHRAMMNRVRVRITMIFLSFVNVHNVLLFFQLFVQM